IVLVTVEYPAINAIVPNHTIIRVTALTQLGSPITKRPISITRHIKRRNVAIAITNVYMSLPLDDRIALTYSSMFWFIFWTSALLPANAGDTTNNIARIKNLRYTDKASSLRRQP